MRRCFSVVRTGQPLAFCTRDDRGILNAKELREALHQRGFTGSLNLVKQYVASLRSQRGVEPTPSPSQA